MTQATVPLGNDKKLRELILYISRHSEGDQYFGATKLNKLLFYSDFAAHLYLGKSITEHEYQVLPQGPAPRQLVSIRNQMVQDKELHIRESDSFPFTQKIPLALRKPDLSVFNGEEIALVDDILAQCRQLSAAQINEKSHQFINWCLVEDGETIPYSMVLIRPHRQLTPTEQQWGKELEPMAREVLGNHA